MGDGRLTRGQALSDEAVTALVGDLWKLEEFRRRTEAESMELLAQLSVLRELEALWARPRPNEDRSTTEIISSLEGLLQSAVNQLIDHEDQEAATYLMRLNKETSRGSQQQLQRLAASCYLGRRPKGFSPDSARPQMQRASFMKKGGKHDQLLALLAETLITVVRTQQTGSPPRTGNARGLRGPKDLANDWRYLSVSTICIYRSGKIPDEIVSHRVLLAGREAVEFLRWTVPDADKASFEVLAGGVARFALDDAGGKPNDQVEVRFTPPIAPGEERFLLTRSKYNVQLGEMNYRRFIKGPQEADSVTLGVRFAPDAQPARVWWYEDLPRVDTPGTFSLDRELKIPPDSRYVERRFLSPKQSLCYGLGWHWEVPEDAGHEDETSDVR